MRQLLILIVILAPCAAWAQLPNPGFETWEPRNGSETPAGWYSGGLGAGRTRPAHSGQNSVTVWNWYYYSRGYVIAGGSETANLFALERTGVPIETKPARLSGYYMYDVGPNQGHSDSAVVVLLLKRYNRSADSVEIVGSGTLKLPPAAEYTRFVLNVQDHMPGINPDSIVVALISSDSGFCGLESDGTCCYFTVDDLTLDLASGVSLDAGQLFAPAAVHPNPMRGAARLEWTDPGSRASRVVIYDARGAVARTITNPSGGACLLGGDQFSAGAYRFAVIDALGNTMASGGFVVE